MIRRVFVALAVVAGSAFSARAADLVALSPQTWDRYVPQGKEVDCIDGDFVLANDQILAIVGNPRRGRNANMTVREVGGCIIDLTRRDRQSDQLSAYYPGAQLRDLKFAGIEVQGPEVYEAAELDRVFVRAKRVTLKLVASPREKRPDVEVAYSLGNGDPFIEVTTTYSNRGTSAIDAELLDSIRADNTFDKSPNNPADLFWAYDRHFGQAYGIVAEGHKIRGMNARAHQLRFQNDDGKVSVQLAPGESYRLTRRIIPAANLFDVRKVADRLAGKTTRDLRLVVKDGRGKAIEGADVVLEHDGKPHLWGRTDENGRINASSEGQGTLTVSALGHGSKAVPIDANTPESLDVELAEAGAVVAHVTDEKGGDIPCKVQFLGKNGTADPDFGPTTGEHAVKNVYYSQNGKFRRVLDPGTYDVIVSFGNEHDAVFTEVTVERGKETPLDATLVRSVKSDGWISADFHNHSSPSGDNTASQLGRVLNLLCEQIEFAPCTEHNRLSTYDPHLKSLGVEGRMGTCVGIEATGKPLPLNHQNAFPLILRPHTQNGGGPEHDDDPEIQIQRLASWDNGSEKLVQVNHPDVGWMFRDRNGDGKPDQGFSGMFGAMDIMEVHPPHQIFEDVKLDAKGNAHASTIVGWLQLLNQGKRIPGVVNTDAHENFHGSGFLRSYLKSPTDDPARIKTLDVVHAAEQGHLVMTNGPFLEVKMKAGDASDKEAIPGDDLAASGGQVTLQIRVQCPNWHNVDRVQVFLNGRPSDSLNFTRAATPDRFSDSTIKFEQSLPIQLEHDTHVIVAVIGEHSKLGPVIGPSHAADLPVAVSNPIFVDVDGGGFKANGDKLGGLPTKNVK
jgi:hypothetical protein